MLYADVLNMTMVARYKKNGGFVQLLQVMETCGPRKYEQFISIISSEDPNWAEAIKLKMLTFDKILSWNAEALLEVVAQVNTLAFSMALKSLSSDNLKLFLSKLSPQDIRKFELLLSDINPNANEISSCIMKVISETRVLLISGVLKIDKIDSTLLIPENFEDKLSLSKGLKISDNLSDSDLVVGVDNLTVNSNKLSNLPDGNLDLEKFQKKILLLNRELQLTKQENAVLKDKLDKIKKIA
ncbi:MAG: FliG C-terminal domain-containing protein [Pseudobdellovibrio sp.]